jgi:hypothetical protein
MAERKVTIVKETTLHLSAEDIAKLSPEAQQAILFPRDLLRKFKTA